MDSNHQQPQLQSVIVSSSVSSSSSSSHTSSPFNLDDVDQILLDQLTLTPPPPPPSSPHPPTTPSLTYVLSHVGIKAPSLGPGSSYNLYPPHDFYLHPFEALLVDTGVRIQLPPDHVGFVTGGSVLSRSGIFIIPSQVDNPFIETIKVMVTNVYTTICTLVKEQPFAHFIVTQRNLTPLSEAPWLASTFV